MIKTIAVFGAGAVGAYFVEKLSLKFGDDLCVIAEGDRAKRLSEKGLILNGKHIDINVKSIVEAAGTDLLIVACKYNALKENLEDIKALVKDNTIVLSPLNGVDAEEIIAETLGSDNHVVPSFMKIASSRSGNEINYKISRHMGVFYGARSNSQIDSVEALTEAFDGSEIFYHKCENIVQGIWAKYCDNIRNNIPQAIIGAHLGCVVDSENVKAISDGLKNEVIAVAAAKGIDITDELSTFITKEDKNPIKRLKYSTLQDLEAGRKTEIYMFCGRMVEMGKELGIPTPYNEISYYIIKALEEKNEGMFDYAD